MNQNMQSGAKAATEEVVYLEENLKMK